MLFSTISIMIINNLLALALMVFGSPEDELTVDAAPRRTSRCPGCKLSGDNHHFGSPGPQCSGPAQIDISEVQVSPKAPTSGAKKPARKKDRVPAMSIDAQLEHCATEERRLREELEHQTKMKQLQEANARVEALRRQVSSSASQQPLIQPPTQRSENAVNFPLHPYPRRVQHPRQTYPIITYPDRKTSGIDSNHFFNQASPDLKQRDSLDCLAQMSQPRDSICSKPYLFLQHEPMPAFLIEKHRFY